jgi:hypothetical protein
MKRSDAYLIFEPLDEYDKEIEFFKQQIIMANRAEQNAWYCKKCFWDDRWKNYYLVSTKFKRVKYVCYAIIKLITDPDVYVKSRTKQRRFHLMRRSFETPRSVIDHPEYKHLFWADDIWEEEDNSEEEVN